jgi:hypothetical protein
MQVQPGLNGKKPEQVGVSMEAMGMNIRQMMLLRTVVFIAAGIICGILGLTGLLGALFYIAVGLIASAAVLVVVGFEPNKYFMVSNVGLLGWDLLNFNHILSFILFWTLSYALVYIY